MAALALELCCTLMADKRSGPNVGLTVRNKVLPQALTLIRSSLLQGQALLVPILYLVNLYVLYQSMLRLTSSFGNHRHYKTFLAPWFTQQIQALMYCLTRYFQLQSQLPRLVPLPNRLYSRLLSVWLFSVLLLATKNVPQL